MLARLHASNASLASGPVAITLLRPALRLLINEPPLDLGRTLLAQLLLAKLPDSRARGELLRQALRTAIERLQPPDTVRRTDRRWWPHRICFGEYVLGQSRAEPNAP
jgi:hypothetical protein